MREFALFENTWIMIIITDEILCYLCLITMLFILLLDYIFREKTQTHKLAVSIIMFTFPFH